MPSTSAAWFTGAKVESDSFVIMGAERIVAEYDKLVITAMCVTKPDTGMLEVKIQHSPDFNSGTPSPNWADLIVFDSMDTNSEFKTATIEDFHSDIRVVARNSESGAVDTILSVYIRDKRIGAV